MKSFKQFCQAKNTSLTEADAQRDYSFRSEADDVYAAIYRRVMVVGIDGFKLVMSRYRCIIGHLIDDSTYNDIGLVLAADCNGSGYFSAQESSIVLKVDSKLANDKYFKEIFRDPRTQSVFVHEFVHFLDSKRIGKDNWKAAISNYSGIAGHNPDMKKYYNQELEFNAYFQQGASQVDAAFRTVKADWDKALFDTPNKNDVHYALRQAGEVWGDFDSFTNLVLNRLEYFSSQWYSAQTNEHKRKFKLRLYQLYQLISPEIIEYKDRLKAEYKKLIGKTI